MMDSADEVVGSVIIGNCINDTIRGGIMTIREMQYENIQVLRKAVAEKLKRS